MRPTDSQKQLSFSFAAPVVIPQGDGSYVVRPGKPVQWLKVKHLAALVPTSSSTVYRAIKEGQIPDHLVRPVGKRAWVISAEALDYVLGAWKSERDAR